MDLARIVTTSRQVAATRLRTEKIALLAETIADAGLDEVEAVTAFLSGEPRQGKVGVGYAALFTLDIEPADASSLRVGDLDRVIDRLPELSGEGSTQQRRQLLSETLARATADEQDFIRRLFTGEISQGALEGLVVEAVARASGIDVELIRRVVMLRGDLPEVARVAMSQGEGTLERLGIELGRPIRPMLARSGSSITKAMQAIEGPAVAEWKLDGARIQVHRDRDRVWIFTRNLNEVTERLPEIAALVRRLPGDRLVLDGEAVAVSDDGRPLAFAETMSRFGSEADTSQPLEPYFFDLLHHDGEDLIDRPLHERHELLDRAVSERHRVPRQITSDPAAVEAFGGEARRAGHEGLMIKDPRSVYRSGRRGSGWSKVKPVHTLDLVVLAAEWGHGRRQGWLSNLHLGARDPASGGFVMLGKTFKGLSDSMLEWQTQRLSELEIRRRGHIVYVRPELVVEVAFDGVVRSPRYPAGVALRFARVRSHRPDKPAVEADTIDTVLALHAP